MHRESFQRSSGFTNREIGQFFGTLSYSAVTKVCRRFEEALKTDKVVQATTAGIERQISQFKG